MTNADVDSHAMADSLVQALTAKGLVAEAYKTRGHFLYPFVWAFDERSELTAYIYVAPNDDGVWYYWYAITLGIIAPGDQAATAADMIAKELKPTKVRLIPVRAI